MRPFPIILAVTLILASAGSAFAQRDANTASARAAYSAPGSSWYSPQKKKKKSKKIKARKSRKDSKKNSDAARQRRRSLQHF